MDKYKITQSWFINSSIHQHLTDFVDKAGKNTILEIGSFEGLSAVFFADNFLDNQESSLTCVDPFLNIDTNDHKQYLQNNEEMNFDYNISKCKNSEKIEVHKITSDAFFEKNTKTFNFIYIDGSHEPEYITRDMENAFKVLEKNGIMWMDDYGGGHGSVIKNAMDNVVKKLGDSCETIHTSYQLAIRKL